MRGNRMAKTRRGDLPSFVHAGDPNAPVGSGPVAFRLNKQGAYEIAPQPVERYRFELLEEDVKSLRKHIDGLHEDLGVAFALIKRLESQLRRQAKVAKKVAKKKASKRR